MSVGVTGATRRPEIDTYRDHLDQEPYDDGWLTFAGVMLGLIGAMNVLGGIAALDGSRFFLARPDFLVGDLSWWGWVLLLTGGVQLVAALGIWAKSQAARWLGLCFAAANAVAQLLFIAAFPLWSLALFAIDMLVVYALLVHAGDDVSAA